MAVCAGGESYAIPATTPFRRTFRFFICYILGYLLLFFVLMSGCDSRSTTKAPALRIAHNSLFLGEAAPGETVHGEFEVFNDGGGELLISSIHPSCTCTYVTPRSDIRVAPQSVATISVKLIMPEVYGDQRAQLEFVSNDVSNPIKVIEVWARMRQLILVAPRQLNFGDLEEGGTAEITAELLRRDRDKGIDTTRFKCTSSSPCVSVPETFSADGTIRIRFNSTMCSPDCRHGSVTIKDELAGKSAQLQVFAHVAPSILVIPSKIVVTQTDPLPHEWSFIVKSNAGQALGQLLRIVAVDKSAIAITGSSAQNALSREYGSVARLGINVDRNSIKFPQRVEMWFSGVATPAVLTLDSSSQATAN